MKISKLPPEIRILALQNQLSETGKVYSKTTDNLSDAFSWFNSPQGQAYWLEHEISELKSEKPAEPAIEDMKVVRECNCLIPEWATKCSENGINFYCRRCGKIPLWKL
jgi:hypothetical protein